MSEPLLNAIIKLFAIVAKEDEVTEDERDEIKLFLDDNVSTEAKEKYLKDFDSYCEKILSQQDSNEEEYRNIDELCTEINAELTQKQKMVIIIQLIGIILADGKISDREEELVNYIGSSFNISNDEIGLIKQFFTSDSSLKVNSQSILIVDGEEKAQQLHYKHLLRKGLDGFISIIYLSNSESLFVRYIGQSDLYLNGVPLAQSKIRVFGVGSTIRGEGFEPVYYGDVISQFIDTSGVPRISFEAENISFQFPNGKLGLRNISIKEESGGLIGLMGASGAGKSTLLNVLNGADAPSEGKVLINGVDIHKEKSLIEGVIGFVPQDDLLIEDLTVYQNLYYAGKLCFRDLSESELDDLVTKTLSSLGLLETRDLKVGSPLQKTISGGQRKRLNIGLELLREPSVLFVDEPTSGLSSRDSENIMDLLKELSLKGKLIFVVIHQPSSDIFKMFDKLVILDTGGYQIYYGNPVEAVVYFKNIIKMLSSEQGECITCGNVNPEQIFNIIETKVIDEYGNFTDERKVSPEKWNEYFKERITIPQVTTSKDEPPASLRIPGKIKQSLIFTTRDTLSKLANKQYLFINLLEAPVLAFALAYIVRYFNEDSSIQTGYLFSKNLNIPAYFFMAVIVALFMGLTVSAEEIIRDQKILKRERFLNLSRMSYLSSKVIILFVLSAIQTITFVLIGNYVLEIKNMLLPHWLILFSTSCMANLLGLNISSSFNSAVTIYILIPILLIPQLILSGVVVKFDKLNPHITATGKVPWLGEMMTSRWAFEAAMVTQFKDNEYEKLFYKYDKQIAESDYKRIYFIPALESKLDYCYNHFRSDDPEIVKQVTESFEVLKSEILNEEKSLGLREDQYYSGLSQLNLEEFNKEIHDETLEFLEKLKATYARIHDKATAAKEVAVNELAKQGGGVEAVQALKSNYHNEAIADLVKNQNDATRILEKDNRYFQKIYPVYMNPSPSHTLDFRTEFYVPVKHFAGNYIDTFWFNLAVIWSMTILLMITLYFDVLRKIIESLEKLFGKNRR